MKGSITKDERTIIRELDKRQHRDMAEFQWRRVHFPFRGPILFDCRFHGAAEQLVQSRYETLLNSFSTICEGIKENGKVNCTLEDISPRVLELIDMAKKYDYDGIKMCVALKQERMRIADLVSEEIGRDASGDDVRRMGIGDQVVLIGIFQSIQEKLGHASVTVVYDPLYPASRELFNMSGLVCLPLEHDVDIVSVCDTDTNLIDMRRHFLEHPLADAVPCFYGEDGGNPAAQGLWNLGWEHCIPSHLIGHPILHVSSRVQSKIALSIPTQRPFVTCQPLEKTRLNKYSSPAVYSAVLQMINVDEVVFGCGSHDAPKLDRFIRDMHLPENFHTYRVCESLEKWCAIIAKGERMITGNTSGMWLGFATSTPMTVLSRADSSHGTMWNVRPDWFTEDRRAQIEIIL